MTGVITVHRPFPDRKTLGTRYNLRPETRPVTARRLQPGDIVVLEAECPIVVTKMYRRHGVVNVWAKYIWEPPHAHHWPVGEFGDAERVEVAIPGEYPKPTRPTD